MPLNYKQIHAYMLYKTHEYYVEPPQVLVNAVMEKCKAEGQTVSYEEAKKLVSPIDIQRLVKQEMTEKWPEFMSSIPSNPLQSDK